MSRAGFNLLRRVNEHEFDPDPEQFPTFSLRQLTGEEFGRAKQANVLFLEQQEHLRDVWRTEAIKSFGLSDLSRPDDVINLILRLEDNDLRQATVSLDQLVEVLRTPTSKDLSDPQVLVEKFIEASERYLQLRTIVVERLTQVQESLPSIYQPKFYKGETSSISDLTLATLLKSTLIPEGVAISITSNM